MPEEKSSWVEEVRAAIAAPESWRERLRKLPAFRPRELIALSVVVAAVVTGAGVAFVRALPRPASPAPSVVPLPSASESGPAAPPLLVHVTGAVRRSGVYELPAGSRVIDGLRAAGGPAPNADVQALNLARALADGERLYVPRRGEAPPPDPGPGGGSGAGGAGGKVNLNTATTAELDGLPGVGPVLAQRIVDYRAQHGPFRDVKDLLKVDGIGEKKFASLKDLVTV